MFNKIIFIYFIIRSVWGMVNISISNYSIQFKCLLLLLINFSIYVDIRYIEHIFYLHLIVLDNYHWMYVLPPTLVIFTFSKSFLVLFPKIRISVVLIISSVCFFTKKFDSKISYAQEFVVLFSIFYLFTFWQENKQYRFSLFELNCTTLSRS